jgi:hypothetical protein
MHSQPAQKRQGELASMRIAQRITRIGCALACSLAFSAAGPGEASAGDIGHYNPGVLNIRDYQVPADPGVYTAVYQYYYTTGRLNDANGDEIGTLNINPGPGPGLDVNIEVDVDLYALMPMVIWVTDWKILGARYSAVVAPVFANASINAHLARQNALGRSADSDSFGIGDMLVQPLWLGWSIPNFDASFGYGFYAPTGQYDTAPHTLANLVTVRTESPDNIGYGFWSHQFQTAGAWYPWADKRMAVVLAGTYEVNHDKQDFDLTPGQVLSLNWGVSQYLPLKKDQTLLAELGLAGYDTWQVSDDSGSDARNDVHDQAHAVGGQIGVTHVPWAAVLNLHYFYEFASEDRFQGHAIGLSLAKHFGHGDGE